MVIYSAFNLRKCEKFCKFAKILQEITAAGTTTCKKKKKKCKHFRNDYTSTSPFSCQNVFEEMQFSSFGSQCVKKELKNKKTF